MVHSTKLASTRQTTEKTKRTPNAGVQHAVTLTKHPRGYYCKKHKGRTHYFGRVADGLEAAVRQYLHEWPQITKGLAPTPLRPDGLTVVGLVNHFLTAKEIDLKAGDITQRTWDDYDKTCKLVISILGRDRLVEDLRPTDFWQMRERMAKTRNPTTLGNEVQRIRVLFKFACDEDLVEHPVKMGRKFKRPAKRILRQERQKKGSRMLEPRELRIILKAAPQPLKAMILLAVNCGFGNADCGKLPLSALDLQHGWIDFPRPKTAIHRRVALWPETVEALREAIATRRNPRDPTAADKTFITRVGQAWTAPTAISHEYRKLLIALNMYRTGRSFYSLRHIHETVAGETGDQVAVNFSMGHVDNTVAADYREGLISDARMRRVADTVRRWLFRRDSAELWRSHRPPVPGSPRAQARAECAVR
jgi:integrase